MRTIIFRVSCRNHNGKLKLPCNWVKDGCCGTDAKPCNITVFRGL